MHSEHLQITRKMRPVTGKMLCADCVLNGAGLTTCTWGCLGRLAGESAHLINSGEGMKIHFLDFVTRKRSCTQHLRGDRHRERSHTGGKQRQQSKIPSLQELTARPHFLTSLCVVSPEKVKTRAVRSTGTILKHLKIIWEARNSPLLSEGCIQ